jgi:hypothetical protein
MKMIAAVLAAAATLWASGAFAADSGDRTSMPESCSDRSANCVIQDGPPRRRGGEAATNSTPPAGSTSPDNRGSTGAKGGAKPGDASGGTSR